MSPYFLRTNLNKKQIVATKATKALCQSLVHILKILIFGLIGFHFQTYAELIIYTSAAALLGSIFGNKILIKIPDRHFSVSLKILLTLLATRMIFQKSQV